MNVFPILLYHSVSDDFTAQYSPWAVRPDVFAAHMAYLHDHDYTAVTVSQLVGAMDGKVVLAERFVVITFDDGLADFYTGALPILKQNGFCATLYITTGQVGGTSQWLANVGEGQRPMLTWDQIAELQSNGIELGAHSETHPQLDTLSRDGAFREIARSKSTIEDHLGQPVQSFAYPHGYHGPLVRRLVQQAGFTSASGVKNAFSSMDDDRFGLARITVTSDKSLTDLDNWMHCSGLTLAPKREKLQTFGWRVFRRTSRLLFG